MSNSGHHFYIDQGASHIWGKRPWHERQAFTILEPHPARAGDVCGFATFLEHAHRSRLVALITQARYDPEIGTQL